MTKLVCVNRQVAVVRKGQGRERLSSLDTRQRILAEFANRSGGRLSAVGSASGEELCDDPMVVFAKFTAPPEEHASADFVFAKFAEMKSDDVQTPVSRR